MTLRLPFTLAEWTECSWHLHNTRLQRPLLAPYRPVCSVSYFLMTKCLCETIGVDFSPNPGYSVGSLCGSGSQWFRRLTKHDCFTSAPLAACNAFHTGKERWAREWGSMDSYSNVCWAGLGGDEGRATPATITHHSTALNLEKALKLYLFNTLIFKQWFMSLFWVTVNSHEQQSPLKLIYLLT